MEENKSIDFWKALSTSVHFKSLSHASHSHQNRLASSAWRNTHTHTHWPHSTITGIEKTLHWSSPLYSEAALFSKKLYSPISWALFSKQLYYSPISSALFFILLVAYLYSPSSLSLFSPSSSALVSKQLYYSPSGSILQATS